MKKLIAIALLSILLPASVSAYTTSGSRSYSAPSRSYSSPSRSYSSPSRSYTSPSRSYTVTPSKSSYSAPTRTYTNTKSFSNTSATPATVHNYSYNPFMSNFFLWYWFFGRDTNKETINKINATTTYATTTIKN